ncbi:MAG: UDP-N-acetylmuramoyl-L-alanine--D-glutamate ligase, partial [Nitrospirae bacterium]|nr:UDP-N-acetylmuramoyl-L-alanine--D-glutamate ligase [Nitrospirota bacterium]
TVTDKKSHGQLSTFIAELDHGVKTLLGGYDETELNSADMIVLSPGVPLVEIEKMVSSNVEIIGELELAYRVLNMLECPPLILSITGTNGKTTATTLLGEILKRDRKNTLVAGNIGNAITTELLKFKIGEHGIESNIDIDLILLEVSSFQLETIERFRPYGSAILNIAPDHLDRYRDLTDYAEAKYRIFLNQNEEDFIVLNADCPKTYEIGQRFKHIGPQVYYFSSIKEVTGAYCINGVIHFNLPPGRVKINEDGREFNDLGLTINAKDLLLKGTHNIENVMAVALMALLSGCSFESIKETLTEFKGLHHRIEFVGEVDGVRYYDDSKGTNVDAVVRALESFSEPVILIAGGRDKDGDFNVLAETLKNNTRAVVLIGEAANKINAAINRPSITYMEDTMTDAVIRAKEVAQKGDVVLLSPACASFDMFKDYADRGRHFSDEVKRFMGDKVCGNE